MIKCVFFWCVAAHFVALLAENHSRIESLRYFCLRYGIWKRAEIEAVMVIYRTLIHASARLRLLFFPLWTICYILEHA